MVDGAMSLSHPSHNVNPYDMDMYIYIYGWWYTYPSEKYEFVSWDYDIPNRWKNKIHVPNHQPNMASH